MIRIYTLATALLCAMAAPALAQDLPRLGVVLGETTVSGISSGGYMAGQFQIAHSSVVKGIGIVAAGPYGCAESTSGQLFPYWPTAVVQNAYRALHSCMATDDGTPDVGQLVKRARQLAEDGEIDPLEGLKDDRAYLYSGKADELVEPGVVMAAAALLTELGVPAQNIALWTDRPGGHAFLTEAEGASCETTAAPYIVDCDYDQAGSILAQLLGKLAPKSEAPASDYTSFKQSPFARGIGNSFGDTGIVYVPEDCKTEAGCRVHVFFHGCEQGHAEIGDALVKGSGFARWADANRLVILFPQVKASSVNPKGCWDWWGYSGLDYLSQEAPQIAGVRAMLDRLAETE